MFASQPRFSLWHQIHHPAVLCIGHQHPCLFPLLFRPCFQEQHIATRPTIVPLAKQSQTCALIRRGASYDIYKSDNVRPAPSQQLTSITTFTVQQAFRSAEPLQVTTTNGPFLPTTYHHPPTATIPPSTTTPDPVPPTPPNTPRPPTRPKPNGPRPQPRKHHPTYRSPPIHHILIHTHPYHTISPPRLTTHPPHPPTTKPHQSAMPTTTTSPLSSAQPAGWTPTMTAFTQRLLRNGEDVGSVVILLETEFPALVGKVGRGWVDGLRK